MSVEVKAQNTTTLASVKAIYDAADEANTLLDGMRTAATAAGTTLNGIYADAESAKTNATNASEYAARALGNLSTVQSVTETLNWITTHGTMALTQDVALDPTHVYFVREAGGDYHVGSYYYNVVTEPDVDDIATYYELSIDESLNNYVGTHLAVDTEGLWLLPAASGANKVLIATGAGSTYTVAGTYIVGKVNNVDTVLAKFTASGAQIGQTGQTHTEIDYHSLQLIDKEGDAYFYISDLRDKNDRNLATITEVFTGNGTNSTFIVGLPIYGEEFTATDSSDSSNTATKTGATQCTFTTAPQIGATITITYKTSDSRAKAYSLGIRASGNIGAMSFAEGSNNLASGSSSHAEGYGTTASGTCSHAEGQVTEASAMCAHAEGYTTVASHLYSHAEGRYTVSSESCAHAEGDTTVASGELSHAEGGNTTASGHSSHAEGWYTVASGNSSHAQNTATIAQRKSQTVIGELNIADTGGTDETTRGDYAFIIGNGTADNARSNALTVDWSGNVTAAGGADLAAMTESSGTYSGGLNDEALLTSATITKLTNWLNS